MRKLELLAPAKNLLCGMAAIDHGADAVYIGPPQFGARAAAGNSMADIQSLCEYAHPFGCKVYATVNTLLRDDELPVASRLFDQMAEAGVDAVLIQDMRLLPFLAAPRCSMLIPHASTQADNRTAEQVHRLYEQGFRRAVLARELSVQEVAAIHRSVPQMELEVFVHGALCVCYSGRCYASEHCFHRSANRGECAQFCRLQFDLLDADGKELMHQKHLLSLKDLNLSMQLGDLIDAGATSFKIEGRLKDVTYVKNVTAAYSQLLNDYINRHPGSYERSSWGVCRYSFQPDLSRTFNRGYTTYFAHGRQPSMASFHTPKAIGQQVGTVKELRAGSFTVAGTTVFSNGDGLCFFDENHQLQGFRVNRVEGNRLFPQRMPASLRPGMSLYRSNDQSMERQLSKISATRKIPVSMHLRTTPDGFALSMRHHGGSQSVIGAEVSLSMEHQLSRSSQRDTIARELSKLGNTPYECVAVDIPTDFPYFIPASGLAALRRKLAPPLTTGSEAVAPAADMPVSNDVDKPASPSCQIGMGGLSDARLMQCRYCLRYELGCCVRHGGNRPYWKEPLRLRMGDGRTFRLEFDCAQCQMNVWAEA